MISYLKDRTINCLKPILYTTIVAPLIVLAGGGSTGGGAGVLCYRNDQIIGVESYDFYKGRSDLYHFVIPFSQLPYVQQVQQRIDRLRRLDVRLANQMQELLPAFEPQMIESGKGNVIFVDRLDREGDEALDLSPGEDYLKEHGCDRVEVSRIASFFPFDFPGQARFHLVSKIWKILNEETKAAIVQHEMIYSLAKHYFKNPTSAQAQYFNAFISSASFETLSPTSYYELLRSLEWFVNYQKYYKEYPKTYEGILDISMSSIRFMGVDFIMEDNLIVTVEDITPSIRFDGYILPNPPPVQFQGQTIIQHDKNRFAIDSNGGFAVVNKNSFSLKLPNYSLHFISEDLKPYEYDKLVYINSRVASGVIEEVEIPFFNGMIRLPHGTHVSNVDRQTGKIESFTLPRNSIAVFTSDQGKFPITMSNYGNKLDSSIISSEGKIQYGYFRFCEDWKGKQLIINKKIIKPKNESSYLNGVYELWRNGDLINVSDCFVGGEK